MELATGHNRTSRPTIRSSTDDRAKRAEQHAAPRHMTVAMVLDPMRHRDDHFRIFGRLQAHVNEHAMDVVLVATVPNTVIHQATQGVID